ncbi:STAS domain-containing protein [Halodesulfovibrio aestuarii]|uniref:Anti-sigma factor antagonist n=1 Tax=Halodesulfovibrio aestuarii TaxID=126333 RepID=A0A8G2FB72_9BACT|nr:STAS domain-containing protein [Halodesulfovibrio aestuarii]SHJ26418.1 anti-anti-sigma factor [Halodesulfovibrio aestuarii]
MDIMKDFKEDIAIVTVNGKMDAVNAGQYQEAIEVLLNDGATKFAVDLSGLQYISSAGLRSILMGGKLIASKSGTQVICGLSGMVKEVFDVSGFSTMFSVVETQQDALVQLGG